ncbi:LysR family transcriptional regulator [Nocardia sp. NPDC051052]|uniref:LysR family transcriptional regulator n=1 Tax=Nocardia sp. NPDC051052 TaxID=3364322 RepID=UPI0037B02128
MEIRHLRYFLAVARDLNFTKAAAALRMSVPPLSQRIKALERELGQQLFDRSTHHTRLTRAGETLLPLATTLVAEFDALPALLRTSEAPTPLRLAIPDLLNPQHWRQLLQVNRALSAGYALEVQQLPSTGMAAQLLSHNVDIAISHVPANHPEITTTTLYTEAMSAILDTTHFPDRTALEYRELRGFTYIPGSKSWSVAPEIQHKLADVGISVDPGLRVADHAGMQLLLQGRKRFSIVMPNWDMAEYVDRRNFAILALPDLDATMTTYLLHRNADTWLTPVVAAYSTNPLPTA